MPPTFTIDESTDEFTASVSAKGGRRLVRSFEVYTDAPATTTPVDVVEAIGSVLGIYITSPHPSWPPAVCEEIDPGRPDRDDPALWRVRVVYSEPVPQPGTTSGTPPGSPPPPPPPPPPGAPPAPADRPAFVTLSYRKVERYETEDLDHKQYRNSAGDLLEDVPPRFRGLGTLNYTRYFASWNENLGLALIGKVNLFAWNGRGVYSCLIDGIEAQPKTERGFTFWEVKFVILHDPHGWIPTSIMDAGRRAYARGKPRVAANLLPVLGTTGVVLLNPAGEQWREDLDGDPVPLDFRQYDSIDFTGL